MCGLVFTENPVISSTRFFWRMTLRVSKNPACSVQRCPVCELKLLLNPAIKACCLPCQPFPLITLSNYDIFVLELPPLSLAVSIPSSTGSSLSQALSLSLFRLMLTTTKLPRSPSRPRVAEITITPPGCRNHHHASGGVMPSHSRRISLALSQWPFVIPSLL